jgi:hypothetical protein
MFASASGGAHSATIVRARHAKPAACPIPSSYRHAFVHAANNTALPLAMLVAVGQIESEMTPTARSSADARGLLQVLPSTAAALRLDVDRPATNVLAGPTAVAEAGGAPTQETLGYVANVTSLWRDLRGCRSSSSSSSSPDAAEAEAEAPRRAVVRPRCSTRSVHTQWTS